MTLRQSILLLAIIVAISATLTFGAGARTAAAEPAADNPDTISNVTGSVVETMNAGQYTYALVDDGSKKIWAAGPLVSVKVGDKVTLASGVAMRNFPSKSLRRTFDVVYFVPAIQMGSGKVAGDAAMPAHGMPPLHAAEKGSAESGMAGHPPTSSAPATVDLSNIMKAEGGQTVAELFAGKADLAGEDVSVRGRVVKFTRAVMGKNWMHIQDGSGSAGSNDLTVSTNATASVGDTVLVRGKLSTDKDLGYGYHYDIIIEDGSVTAE